MAVSKQFNYEPMLCKGCGQMIMPDLSLPPKRTLLWAKCIFRCECGGSYSNSKEPQKRIWIWREPASNVPPNVREGLDSILARCLNARHRHGKRHAFGSLNSEDAVTWTIFRALQMYHLRNLLAALVAPHSNTSSEPIMLLWGASADEGGTLLRTRLVAILDGLGENPQQFSEPDVILVWPNLVIFIEVKYTSPNEKKPGYENFVRYLDHTDLFAVPTEEVKQSGYYELTRNWRIGTEFAGSKEFVLVSLGPSPLKHDAEDFRQQLAETGDRRFAFLQWQDLIDAMYAILDVLPPWLANYIDDRKLTTQYG